MTRIFLSYSRVDKRFVEALADKLRRIYGHENIWFDEGLHGGDIWWEEILEQIADRDIFIYVLSNDSVQSDYCQAEFEEARRLQKQIITIQARDRTKLTDELGDIHYINTINGVDDADALTDLYRSVNKRMTKVSKRTTKPLWQPVTSRPAKVDEKPRADSAPDVDTPTLQLPQAEREKKSIDVILPWWRKPEFIIGAILIPIIASIIGGLIQNPEFFGFGSDSTSTEVVQVQPTTGQEALETVFAQQTSLSLTEQAFNQTATIVRVQNATATAQQVDFNASETSAVTTIEFLSATPPPATNTPPATPPPATLTPTQTNTLEPLIATPDMPDPEQVALEGVTSNTQWENLVGDGGYVREFNGVEMVLVPVGSFEMGSTEDEIDFGFEMCQVAADNGAECQRSWVENEAQNGDNTQTFNVPFWIDRNEVTRAQYQQCMDAGECSETPDSDYSSEPNQPINRVTWFQAQEYCEWRYEGDVGRLPTEAEWEYAARGVDRLIFPWGNEFDGTLANHCDGNCGDADWASSLNYVNEENDDGYAITSPVGSYSQGTSWVGALDMSGNLWEWTLSESVDYPYDADDGRNDNLESTDVLRVLRGGSFLNSAFNLRSADRNWFFPTYYLNDSFGFRCARSFEE